MYTATAVDSGYRTLPLALLEESSINPRRTFEPAKLVELAQSLATHGLIPRPRLPDDPGTGNGNRAMREEMYEGDARTPPHLP